MKLKFVLFLSLTVVLGALLYAYIDAWSLKPFDRSETYSNISKVAIDDQQSVYTITDSKRLLNKVNRNGELVYSLESNGGVEQDNIQLFNSIAADAEGNAYALVTVLDSFGLKVSGEWIIRISPDGSRMDVLHSVTYSAEENLLRVGKIQSLSAQDGYLYFYQKGAGSASMMRLTAASANALSAQAEAVATIEMPENRYVSELTGTNSEQFFFTSKRGRLFAAPNGSETIMLYPGEGTVQLNFPVEIETSDGRHVYFIDYHEAAIQRLDSGQPDFPVVSILRMDALAEQFRDIEWSDFSHLFVGNGTITVATTDQIVQADASGNVLKVMESYHFPASVVYERLGYWALLALFVLMLLATIRHTYVHLMKRRVSLLLKQLLVIVPIILAAMGGLSYSVYNAFSNEMREEMRGQLELLAGNGKYIVDGSSLENIDSPLDFASPDYQEIKRRMNDLFSQAGENRDGLYSTVYKYVDGNLYIITDDDDSVTMFRPFPTSEENLQVLEKGMVVSGEWEDASGQWMYALGPLYGTNGDIIGIYETGKDMNGVIQNNLQIISNVIAMIAAIGGVILLVVTMMAVYLLSSIRRLRRSVNLIASGEWDAEVRITTRDEVAELGERFNMMAASVRRYIKEITGLSEAYFRFVPQQFLTVLGKQNMTQVKLGDQVHRRMTVLVCNMRDFSDFSMKLSPEDNFRFINSFLKVFGPVVRKYGGFTSRYSGPGMLSMFPNDAGDALKAAVKMRSTLETYNRFREGSGYEPIDIGISVHIGDVMIGIIGEEQRMEGSVVSDQVLLAAELEKASAKLGVSVLVTEDALRSLKKAQRVDCRRLGAIQLYGDNRTMELYDIYEGDSADIRKLKQETQQQFEQAVEMYRNGKFYDAREEFVNIVKKNRWDAAAKLYFFACDQYYQQGVAGDWNGALRIS